MSTPPSSVPSTRSRLRVIAFGAHPDDCELYAGGAAAKWAAAGADVRFVSVTNGDIGHWREAGGPLALRRLAEVQRTAQILGMTSEVLDLHDGELMPTLENRRTICRLIRAHGADLVISHRPNDYHPDHRAVAQLVQDAGYMVMVPHFCPDSPALKKNPVFLFSEDDFTKPMPFRPDVVVAIDDVIEKKLDAVDALESQFFEGGCLAGPETVPPDAAGRAARRQAVRAEWRERFALTAKRFREKLIERYGAARGQSVVYAEAFELCEYGTRPTSDELGGLFGF
jgi:LmbE family N-acetylglucosaminyl deacetylase